MATSEEIINKVFSTTGSKITEKDISLIVYLATKNKSDKEIIDATVQAVEHLQHKLKNQPDSIVDIFHTENERILVDAKKVVNQILKYIKSNQ